MSRSRSISRELFYTLILTVFLLGMIEGIARVIIVAYRGTTVDYVIVTDPILNHRWTPKISYFNRNAPIPFYRVTNKQGWVESYDVELEKPKNTYRVFYVGDSNTEGSVNSEYKMVEIVERQLNQTFGKSGKKFEVINTGTTSFSVLPYYLIIKTEILKYSPDLVVINIDMTDVPNDSYYKSLTKWDHYKLPLAIGTSPAMLKYRYRMTPYGLMELTSVEALTDFLTRNVIAFRLGTKLFEKIAIKMNEGKSRKKEQDRVERKVQEERGLKPGEKDALRAKRDPSDWLSPVWTDLTRENVDFSMHILGLTIDLLKAKGVQVMVTGVPHYLQFMDVDSSMPHLSIKDATLKQGGLYLNSFDGLKKIISGTKQSEYYFDGDPSHLNKKGHAAWAEIQFKFLVNHKAELLGL